MSALVIAPVERPYQDERATIFSIIESALHIRTPEQFLAWTEGELQDLFPHGALICGTGQINRHSIRTRQLLFKHFPQQYIEAIRQADNGIQSPVMARWVRERQPQLFEAEFPGDGIDAGWLDIFRAHDLRNIAAHGVHDLNSNVTSYFSFFRIPERLTPRHSHLLELLVPHMHIALTRVLAGEQLPSRPALPGAPEITARERDILGWLQQGKSNWEIAQILDRSPHTVKNQVRSILVKLRVNNRTQAVSKAIELGVVG
jgi:transcriptional regulator EpsA